MYNNKKTSVIIAAAGQGKRLGAPVPKQYLKIGGEPIIIKTLMKFQNLEAVDNIFIVAGEDYLEFCQKMVTEYGISKVKGIVRGGSQRQDSVFNALKEVEQKASDTELVLIHDAARPFVSSQIITGVLESAEKKGATVPAVPMTSSIRKLSAPGDMSGSMAVDRNEYYMVQTPQGFKKDILLRSYTAAYEDGYYGTDDSSIVERAGYEVAICDGEYGNIKITTKEDMPMEYRVGTGFDVHRFAEGRKLILGGVTISHDRGLLGHSDADVLVHALMDALLGAAGLGDIGRHFPDSDSKYEGISSMKLLEHVKDLLDDNLYRVGNADITLIAQKPKISPYVDEMISGIAEVLCVEKSRINIKGTTTEKLGFTGREEGIACEAVATLYR